MKDSLYAKLLARNSTVGKIVAKKGTCTSRNVHNVSCSSCHEILDVTKARFINSVKVAVVCTCGRNNFLRRTRISTSLERNNDGSLIRKHPKIHESKKDRKRRRVIEKGWAR